LAHGAPIGEPLSVRLSSAFRAAAEHVVDIDQARAYARPDEPVCMDSPLEGDGFEPSVPRSPVSSLARPAAHCCEGQAAAKSALRFSPIFLLSLPFHRAGGVHSFGGLRPATLLDSFCFPAVKLIYTFAFHRLDQQFAERPYQGVNAVR
jgi:hypothetical protein